jgi:CBS domain containing-hemolysin-like protein
MSSDTIIAIVVLIVGLVTLILLGAAEAGVISGVRERVLREPEESRAKALHRFYEERQLTLATLALARNLASVAVAGVAVYLALREATDEWPAMAATIVLTATGFVVLQGFTRTLVARNPQAWQRALWPLVTAIRFLFRFPVLLLDAPMEAVIHTWQRYPPKMGPEELLMLTAEMEDATAALPDAEREMIRGVMDLEFTSVREVMAPRPDIIAVDVEDGFDELVQAMIQKGFSRIPVYEEDVDHILGIAHAKDLMRYMINGQTRPPLREVLRPAYVVPESKKVQELLTDMKQRHISIAVVVDEYGGVAGLVTLEDLIEEIVGEIRDEFDVEEEPLQEIAENEVIVDGGFSIDELNEMFDMEIEKGDYDSVGGFIVNELGRMPSVGDSVSANGVSMKVLSVAGRRVKKVRVVKSIEHEADQPSSNGSGK